MSIILTEEELRQATHNPAKATEEEKAKAAELGRKMRSLSAEERRQLVLKAEEDKLLK